jgi:hypothetical protein
MYKNKEVTHVDTLTDKWMTDQMVVFARKVVHNMWGIPIHQKEKINNAHEKSEQKINGPSHPNG